MGPPVESSNCCACGVKRCVVGILIMGIALLGGLTGGTIVYLFHHSFHHHRINLTASECGNIHNNIKHITQNRSGLHNDTVSASPIVSGMKVPGDGREAAVSIGPQFAAPTTLNTVAVTQSLSTTVLTSASNPLTTLVSSTTPYTTQVASESSVVQPRTPTSSIDKDQTSNPTTSTLILSTLSVTQEIHDNSSQPQIDSSTSHANNYSAVSPDNDTVLTTTTVNSQISDRNEYIVYNESGNANGDVASQVVVDSKNDTNNSYDGYDENGVDYDNDSEESSEIGEDIDVLHLNKSSGVTEPQTTTIDTLHVDPNSIVNKITRNMRIGDGSHAHHKMESNEALKVPLNKFPKFFDPILYEVMFDYDEVTLKMNGRLNLTFNVVQASASVFFLHQFHLFFSITEDLRPKFIEYGSNREFPWQELEVNSTQGTIAFYMEKEFKYGANYTLVLNFHTHNICKIEGVMCSQAPSNNHWQFVTNFEPAFARFLFPCLDQPDMKANFRIGMTYTNFDDGFSILGNEDICSDYNIGKKRTVVFCDTVKMPTYLVVLAFGRFETFCSYAANSMKMCIYVEDSPKLVPRGIGAKLIEDFVYIFQVVQDYFEVPYLMSKLDFVFMRDFNNAGMEFFGTILFHIDDFFETIFQTGIIDYTSYRLIVHEVVHLWIGDSVTMADHNDIWLKEAFAQFFGAYLMKHENYTRINGFQEYMEKEDMMESHEDGVSTNPLQLSATTIGGVRGAYQNRGYFDLYIRGESFVGLLKHLVGGDAQLKQCMTEYLTKFAGKSVEPFDLWTVLSPAGERAGLNFEMDKGLKTWLTEKTQPEIHIKRRSMDVPNRTQVRCKQSPARNSHNAWIAPKPDNKDNGEVLWHIPLTFGTIDNKFRFWFSTKMQKLTIEENLDDRWLLANADRQFPYRVDYDKDNWQLLIKQLKRDPELFSIQTRSMLIMDANYFMYNTRRLPLLIQLLGYLELEKHPLPWHYGISVIGELIPRLRHTADYKIVREYFSKIASTLASRMRDVEFRAFLENTFLSNMFFEKSCNFLCYTGHAACTGAFIGTGLTKRFSTYLNGRGQHSQSFNNSVCYRAFYCHYLLEHATKEDANLLIDFIQNHTHSDYDYGEIMPLILCYRNDSSILQAVVKKYLELVGTSNSIKIDRIVQLAAGSPTSYVFNRQVYYIWRNLKSIIAANGEGYHQTISAMNKASHRFIFAKDSAKYNFVDSINRPQLLRMVRQMVGPRFRQFRVELLEEMTWLSDLHIDSKLNILVG